MHSCLSYSIHEYHRSIDTSIHSFIHLSVDPSHPTNSHLLFDADLSYNWFCNVLVHGQASLVFLAAMWTAEDAEAVFSLLIGPYTIASAKPVTLATTSSSASSKLCAVLMPLHPYLCAGNRLMVLL